MGCIAFDWMLGEWAVDLPLSACRRGSAPPPCWAAGRPRWPWSPSPSALTWPAPCTTAHAASWSSVPPGSVGAQAHSQRDAPLPPSSNHLLKPIQPKPKGVQPVNFKPLCDLCRIQLNRFPNGLDICMYAHMHTYKYICLSSFCTCMYEYMLV